MHSLFKSAKSWVGTYIEGPIPTYNWAWTDVQINTKKQEMRMYLII